MFEVAAQQLKNKILHAKQIALMFAGWMQVAFCCHVSYNYTFEFVCCFVHCQFKFSSFFKSDGFRLATNVFIIL